MKKRFWKVSNLLLTSLITALGFNACYMQKKPSGQNETVVSDSDTITEMPADEVVVVYGTPPFEESVVDTANTILDDVAIAYGAPAFGDDEDTVYSEGEEALRREWEEKCKDPIYQNMVFDVVENMPRFPGDDGDGQVLYEWIQKNLRYPKEALRDSIKGRVVVLFIVERDGAITDPRVVRPIHHLLDEEALDLMRRMPKWIPGRHYGITARVKFTLPITFTLSSKP